MRRQECYSDSERLPRLYLRHMLFVGATFIVVMAGNNVAADPASAGMAHVCLSDSDVALPPKATLKIPATSVFEDQGPLKGSISDPSSWSYNLSSGMPHAAFATLDPIELRQSKRCSDVRAQMITSSMYTKQAFAAADKHVFTMTDVLDYPAQSDKPAIELGKLVDDISVRAVLNTDITSFRPSDPQTLDDAARSKICLEGAQQLAAHVHGAVGRQTDVVVFLGGLPARDASYGCPLGRTNSDITISWGDRADPPSATLTLVGDAGAFLTGGTPSDIKAETKACVADALKPQADELASREERGIRFECQAFKRDGGAGTITIYRRFGKNPTHPAITEVDASALRQASAAFAAQEQERAASALAFAAWYQDPAIPQTVKTFAMMAARVQTLGERCPSAPSFHEKVQQWAREAGLSLSDVGAGGRYADLMSSVLKAMRQQTAAESVEQACEAAQRYF